MTDDKKAVAAQGAAPAAAGSHLIEVKNLHKTFGDNHVLKGIDNYIARGEKVVVMGPSGSGKSTYLRCLNLLERPDSGRVLIEGRDLLTMKPKELCDLLNERVKNPDYQSGFFRAS